MELNKKQTARKAGFTTGYVLAATLLAKYIPALHDIPEEVTIPAIAGAINMVKNILKFKFHLDIFA